MTEIRDTNLGGAWRTDFTIHNAVKRIEEQANIFVPVLGKGIDMKKALKNLEGLMGRI